MSLKKECSITQNWVESELRLVGTLDSRMISLLKAIDQSGSINQAAKQVGLSYKGAWQMIARANNLAPKILIVTSTGGSKGGGTCLTVAGRSLLLLFTRLELRHKQFLQKLNQSLADDPDVMRLLKPPSIKTSATNQLLGTVVVIQTSAVNAEVFVELKGGEQIIALLTLSEFRQLELGICNDMLVLINAAEIFVVPDSCDDFRLACNYLCGTVLLVQHDDVNSVVVVQLSGGDSLIARISEANAEVSGLSPGMSVYAVFESSAVILGAVSQDAGKAVNQIKNLNCC
ncbi:TOBE domain-containing protein [Methylobacter sp.]|uniref:TOBE domain-containing protein n=1 Tax=Methylobacter sp. TaxID=2051955 RepID=UPI002FDE16C7